MKCLPAAALININIIIIIIIIAIKGDLKWWVICCCKNVGWFWNWIGEGWIFSDDQPYFGRRKYWMFVAGPSWFSLLSWGPELMDCFPFLPFSWFVGWGWAWGRRRRRRRRRKRRKHGWKQNNDEWGPSGSVIADSRWRGFTPHRSVSALDASMLPPPASGRPFQQPGTSS